MIAIDVNNKLQLPTVTCIIVDCLNVERSIKVLEHCKKMVDFGATKLLTSIPTDYHDAVKIMPLNSLIAYSIFMLTRVHQYINTEHLLVVQRDGWILNPDSWDEEWLSLDFIGGIFMQMDRVGSGGFSLRSKKIMEDVSKTLPEWDGTQKDADRIQSILFMYEDGELSLSQFSKNYKIASLDQAANFSQAGNRNPQYFRERSFGYHRTWQSINFQNGLIDSSDGTRDIKAGYDEEIDKL
jgi:hypothetical protein